MSFLFSKVAGWFVTFPPLKWIIAGIGLSLGVRTAIAAAGRQSYKRGMRHRDFQIREREQDAIEQIREADRRAVADLNERQLRDITAAHPDNAGRPNRD